MQCTMSAEEDIRLDRVCRTCLREETGLRSLFEGLPVAPHQMLAALSSRDPAAEGDGLPHQICSQCAERLAAAYSFQRACERSAARLQRSSPPHLATSDCDYRVIKSEFKDDENNKTDCFGANQKTYGTGVDVSVQTLAEYFHLYNCPVCQKKFRSLFGLNSHLKRHGGLGRPACPACGRPCPCAREWRLSTGRSRKKRTFKAKINDVHVANNHLTLNCQNCKNCFDNVKLFENHTCHSESGAVAEGWTESPELAESIKEEPLEADESPGPPSPCQSDGNLSDKVKREASCDDSDYEPLKYIKSKEKNCVNKSVKLKKTPKLAAGTLPCASCPRLFASKTQLEVHSAKHSGKTIPYSCSICRRTFTRYSHLKRHGVVHSPSRRLSCAECKKTFTRPEHLQRHVRSHAEGTTSPPPARRRRSAALLPRDKVAFCEDCGRGFCSLRSLQRHVLRLHPAGVTFSCSVCARTFPSRKPLREHEARHRSLTRPLLCSECGSSFRRSGDLAVHMRRHRGEKPYSCRFCPKAFPRSTDLVTHERYHTEDKAHACAVCGKTFHRQYNLKVHLRVHSGERPYACPHCDRAFAQSNDLKAHVRRHTGERFACELCGEGFLQSYLLAAHKRRAHQLDCTSHIRRVEKHPTEVAPRAPRAQHRASRQQLAARMAALLLAQPPAPPSP